MDTNKGKKFFPDAKKICDLIQINFCFISVQFIAFIITYILQQEMKMKVVET